MMDLILLEAYREVDAMLPNTPPITPPDARIDVEFVYLTYYGVSFDTARAELVLRSGKRVSWEEARLMGQHDLMVLARNELRKVQIQDPRPPRYRNSLGLSLEVFQSMQQGKKEVPDFVNVRMRESKCICSICTKARP